MNNFSGVSIIVYFFAGLVLIACLGFAVEEISRYLRKREKKRLQRQAWQEYHNWIHGTPRHGGAHE